MDPRATYLDTPESFDDADFGLLDDALAAPLFDNAPLFDALQRAPERRPARQLGRSAPIAPAAAETTVLEGFAYDRDALTDTHRSQLDAVAQRVVASQGSGLPMRIVRIVGHTDHSGSDAYNVQLGRRRAEQVRVSLAQRIDAVQAGLSGRLTFHVDSQGKRKPVSSDSAKNRRVEVSLLADPACGWREPITGAPGQFICFAARAQVLDASGLTALTAPVALGPPGSRAPVLGLPAGASSGRIRLELVAEWPAALGTTRTEHVRAVWDWTFVVLEPAGGTGKTPGLNFLGESLTAVGTRFSINQDTAPQTNAGGDNTGGILGASAWVQATGALASKDKSDSWRYDLRVDLGPPGSGAAPVPSGPPIGGPAPAPGPKGGLLVPGIAGWGGVPAAASQSFVELVGTVTIRPRGAAPVVVPFGSKATASATVPGGVGGIVELRVEGFWRQHNGATSRMGRSQVIWRWSYSEPIPSGFVLAGTTPQIVSESHGKELTQEVKDTPTVRPPPLAQNYRLVATIRLVGDSASVKQTFTLQYGVSPPAPLKGPASPADGLGDAFSGWL